MNDLLAALGSVGPWMLLEDLAERARQKWDSVDATWAGEKALERPFKAGLGPSSGETINLQVSCLKASMRDFEAFEKKLEKLGLNMAAAQKVGSTVQRFKLFNTCLDIDTTRINYINININII